MDNVCPMCFSNWTPGKFCGHCGYSTQTAKKYNGVLSQFSILKNRYLLGGVLGRGGFGITYIAMDTYTNRLCAVKEYMPAEYAQRQSDGCSIRPLDNPHAIKVFEHCKKQFHNEANLLMSLRGNFNVVRIIDSFQTNGTAYIVMEHLYITVKKMMEANGGRLPYQVAITMLLVITSSLMEIHRMGLLHRDITPENIMCPEDGIIDGVFKLIDFGSAREAGAGLKSVLLKKGYAPPEQYDSRGNQGPWTDIYALCATFYHVVSGVRVEESIIRIRRDNYKPLHLMDCGVNQAVSDIITKGLDLDEKKRYQNCAEFLDALSKAVGNIPSFAKNSNYHEQIDSHIPSGQPHRPSPQPAMQAVVEVISGPMKGHRYPISQNQVLTIGRSSTNHIVLDNDSNISRAHCSVRFDAAHSAFVLRDESANGTYLENGTRLQRGKDVGLAPNSSFYVASRRNSLRVTISK